MSKGLIIFLIIAILTSGVIGYYSKVDVKPISKQIDLKSGSNDINWIIGSRSYCDGNCTNKSSDIDMGFGGGGGSSWGGSSGGGGK